VPATPLPAWVPETLAKQANGQYAVELTKENENATFNQDYINGSSGDPVGKF